MIHLYYPNTLVYEAYSAVSARRGYLNPYFYSVAEYTQATANVLHSRWKTVSHLHIHKKSPDSKKYVVFRNSVLTVFLKSLK